SSLFFFFFFFFFFFSCFFVTGAQPCPGAGEKAPGPANYTPGTPRRFGRRRRRRRRPRRPPSRSLRPLLLPAAPRLLSACALARRRTGCPPTPACASPRQTPVPPAPASRPRRAPRPRDWCRFQRHRRCYCCCCCHSRTPPAPPDPTASRTPERSRRL